jgi:hypothetical protein|tara:strand:- start:732 stop:1043 length:312 start_codon:yes stop_codon:yes gene_type:complete
MTYFILGVLAPIILNLLHMIIGIYVVVARGSVMSLGFTAVSFLTKSMGMVFLLWLGLTEFNLNFKIYVPLLSFFWLMTHFVEAFVIQHYMEQNVSKSIQDIQL